MSHVDPLPEELAMLRTAAAAAHSANAAHVDSILSRLERARHLLADTHASPGDELLSLGSYLKTTNADSAAAHKDWGTAVAKLQKSVDKKYGPPPAPLFPPAPQPAPAPSSVHPSLHALALKSASAAGSGSTSGAAADSDAHSVLPFGSPEATAALNETIATHLARIGAFASLDTFVREAGIPTPASLSPELLQSLRSLHAILAELRRGECQKAIAWVEQQQRERTERRPDPASGAAASGGSGGLSDEDYAAEEDELLFQLRKEEFVRLVLRAPPGAADGEATASADAMETEPLLPLDPSARRKSSLASTSSSILRESHGPPDPHVQAALTYGGTHFRPFLEAASATTPARAALVCSLLTSPLYLPLPRLLASPYGHLYQKHVDESAPGRGGPAIEPLCGLFAKAYLRTLDLPRESPLTVVTDVGGSGALAKIQKVRAVMKEKKTEWSATGELPVEVPLPLPYRYHSIFACPVSKEQSTTQNPPMLLPCGHVIARESLMRLARGTPTLKCPYCPVVSHFNACVRVHF